MEVFQIFKGGNKCDLFCKMICKFVNNIYYNHNNQFETPESLISSYADILTLVLSTHVFIKQIFNACIKYIGTCIQVYMKQIHCFRDVKLVSTCANFHV